MGKDIIPVLIGNGLKLFEKIKMERAEGETSTPVRTSMKLRLVK